MGKVKYFLKANIFYVILFCFMLFFCAIFPYTHDDWSWGSSTGLALLNSGFDNYNGRWFGNILVIILTRSYILKTIVMAFVFTGIVYLISKTINKNNKIIPFVITALLFAINPKILAQGFVWTAGFVNYTVSIFLILIYVYLNKNLFNENKVNFTIKSIIPLFLLGCVSSLILENMTLYNILFAIFIIIFTKTKQKTFFLSQISYFVGSVVGAILMFSNSVYSTILNDGDDYRSVGDGGIMNNIVDNYLGPVLENMFLENVILIVILSALLLYVIFKSTKDLNKIQKVAGMIILGYASYILLINIYPSWDVLRNYTNDFEGLITLIYVVTLILFPLLFIKEKNTRNILLFVTLSIGISTGILLAVNPIGPRNFFPPYVLFVMIICILINTLEITHIKQITKFLTFIIIFLALYLLSVYGVVFKNDLERRNYINRKVSEKTETIYFEKLPYENYVWISHPTKNKLNDFKEFYGIPLETKIVVVENGYYSQ